LNITILAFSWGDSEKEQETYIKIFGGPSKIPTGNFLNTIPGCYG
jgi:hypothetical protein